MKTANSNALKALALVSLLMATAPSAMAQDDALLSETESVLNSDQIDIDGSFRKETAADRLAKIRKKIEKQNEDMVSKKIEDIRMENEKKLANQLRNAFNGGSLAQDQISTSQAATQKVEIVAPEAKKEELKNKVIPSFGVTQFNGEEIDGFESSIHTGLTLENKITDRISVGLGVDYTTMEITDSKQINSFNNGYNFNNYNTAGDEIGYKNLNLNINGKFYLTVDTKIKPFLGAGLGYNRTSLKYDKRATQQTNYTYFNNNQQATDTTASASNVTGTALVGAEVDFTENFGITLDFKYTKALTEGFGERENSSNGFNSQSDLDKRTLSNIGSALEDSDQASLNLGLLIRF